MEQNILPAQPAAHPRAVSGQTKNTGGRAGGHSRKKLDLTGQRYGELTVLSPAENVDGRTAWLCRCGCGRPSAFRESADTWAALRDWKTRPGPGVGRRRR